MSSTTIKVKLTASQKKQFDLIAEVKPEWTSDDIYKFCQQHEFNPEQIQQSLNDAFQEQQEWYVTYK